MNSPSPISPTRLMLIADFEHPFVYRSSFPRDIPEVELVLAAAVLGGKYDWRFAGVALRVGAGFPSTVKKGKGNTPRSRRGRDFADWRGNSIFAS